MAGRQNKDNLMALEKSAALSSVWYLMLYETLLALDASTGQNALVQAKEFSKLRLQELYWPRSMNKAWGGVVLWRVDIPVKLIDWERLMIMDHSIQKTSWEASLKAWFND